MRYPPIPPSLFDDRRLQFLKKMRPSSVAIFCSSDPMPRTADQHYPYRQDSHLFALSGLTQPGTILVLLKDEVTASRREMAFILPEDPAHAIWNGNRYTKNEARGISGIRSIYVTTIINGQFSFMAFNKAGMTYDLGRLPIAIGHIGLIMLFCKSRIWIGLQRRLAAVGKMALTNYITHSIICMIFFTGVGFGQFGKLERFELLYVVFSIWIFQLIASPIWLKYYYYGPLEWLWRTLSYQQKPPFRKTNAVLTPVMSD